MGIVMPLFLNDVVFGSAIFLNPSTNTIFLKVASLVLLKARWLVVILTLFGVE
jgi:hypothetical protein